MADVSIRTALEGAAHARSQLDLLSAGLRDAEFALRNASGGAGAYTRNAQNLERMVNRVTSALRGANDAVENNTRRTRRATTAVDRLRNAFGDFRGVLATLGVAAVVKEIVDAAVQADRLNSAMVSATGGFADATKEMAFVRREADSLGISFDAAAKGFIKIAANAEGTVLEGKKTEEIFHGLSVAASALRLSGDDLNGMLLAVGQMMSKGTVQAEELKLQIGERLPGSFAIAAEAMGVTTAELSDMMRKGEVVTNDFLPKFAALLAQKYGAGAENAAKGLSAEITRLDNEWTQLMRDFGTANSGIIENVASSLRGLLGVVREVGEGLGAVSRSPIDALNHSIEIERQNLAGLQLALDTVSASQGVFSENANHLRAQVFQSQAKIGALTIKVRELTPALDEASAAAKKAGAEAGQSGLAFADFDILIGGTKVSIDKLSGAVQQMTDKALKESQSALEKEAKSFEKLIDRLTDLDPAVKQYLKDLEGIKDLAKELNLTQAQQNAMIERAGDLFLEVVAPARDYGNELDRLARSLDANYNKTRTMEEADALFTAEMAKGNLTLVEREYLYRKLGKSLDEISEKKAPKVQQTFESLGSRITTVFENTFDQILANGKISFESLADGIISMFKRIFSRYLANMAASFLGFPGASGGASGAGGGAASNGSGGGFSSMFSGFGDGAVNEFGANYLGFSHGSDFVGPVQPGSSWTSATLGESAAAAGMGVGLANAVLGDQGTVANIAGTAAGVIGTALAGPVAGAAASFVATAAWGMIFKQKPPNFAAVGRIDPSAGTFKQYAQDPDKISEENNQHLAAISESVLAFSQMLKDAGATLADTAIKVDVGSRDGIQVFIGDMEHSAKVLAHSAEGMSEAVVFLLKNITETSEGLNEEAKSLVLAFKGTAEELISFAQAVGTLDKAVSTDVFADFQKSLEQASLSLSETLDRQRSGIVDLAIAYDGSLASTQQLASATVAYQQSLVQLLVQIESVRQGVAQSFGSAKQQIKFGALTTRDEKELFYGELVEGAQGKLRSMGAEADPLAIQRQADIVQKNLINMFNLLSPEERKARRDDFLKNLELTEELANKKLAEAREALKAQDEALREIIKGSMNHAAGLITEAAGKIDTSAARMENASKKLADVNNAPVNISGVMVANEPSMRWLAKEVTKRIRYQEHLEAL